MNGLVLVPHGPNPAAVTRHIEFWEGMQTVTETAKAVNGRFVVHTNIPCRSEADFYRLLAKGKYAGDVRQHTVDGVRILFLEDRRPVVLTTDLARAA